MPWVAVLLACLLAGPARAHPDVDAARLAFLNGDFDETLNRLDAAEHSPATSEDDRVAIHWYRAATFHAAGRTQDAADSLDRLLGLRPLYQPDRAETPPHLRALFTARASAYQQEHGVTLGAPVLDGAALRVTLAGHPEQVQALRVFARPRGAAEYQPFALDRQGAQAQGVIDQTVLWEAAERAGALELVLEAENARGVPVSRAGDALAPLVFPVDAAQAAAARAALAPPPPAVLPELPEHTPHPAPPAQAAPAKPSGLAALFRGPLPAPWVVFALPALGSGVCCMGSCFGAQVLACALPVAAVLTAPTGDFGARVAGVLALLTGMCCMVSCCSGTQSTLFGACTSVFLLTELYYRSVLGSPRERPAAPAADDEPAAVDAHGARARAGQSF